MTKAAECFGMRTGYFGVPGSDKEGGMVHVVHAVNYRWTPICGVLNRAAEFQECFNGVNWDLVECQRCLRKKQ